MKNILISCIVFLFAFHQVEGQTMLSSQVIDATTGKSIPYVNVGVVKKGIGTVTDENGFFEFKLPKRLSPEDILQIMWLDGSILTGLWVFRSLREKQPLASWCLF